MLFHMGLCENMSPHVSRTLLSILTNLNDAVVWIISTRPLISKSSCPFTNPLVTVPSVRITIGVIVTFMFYSFFNSQARSRYLSYSAVHRDKQGSQFGQFTFLLLIITRSGSWAEIRWAVCVLKYQWSFCISLSRTDSGLCKYHLFAWSNFNFLHNFLCIALPTQSCLVL